MNEETSQAADEPQRARLRPFQLVLIFLSAFFGLAYLAIGAGFDSARFLLGSLLILGFTLYNATLLFHSHRLPVGRVASLVGFGLLAIAILLAPILSFGYP